MIQISRLLIFISSLYQLSFGQTFENFNQDENLKTIEFYNSGLSSDNTKMSPPVKSLTGSDYLVLEFDDLTNSYRQFHAKIILCDYNWEVSSIREISYLPDYNDFIINNYQTSQSTKVPYMHYGFRIPEVKLSGNYVLQIFENDVYADPIMQFRFRVFDPQVALQASVMRPVDNNFWRSHHQVDFTLYFGNYDIRNPRTEFLIEIRQNFRDDMVVGNLFPSAVNLAKGEAYYRFFKNENLFPAGNEFRTADLRSTFATGNNVQEIEQGFRDRALLALQENRAEKVYVDDFDINGRFSIGTLDDYDAEVNGDYILTSIFYKPQLDEVQKELFVVGEFNGFDPKESDRCLFDETEQLYKCTQLFKQGIYDFAFATRDRLDRKLLLEPQEGNFSLTGNSYEIFVYHLAPAGRTEKLIGYFKIENSKTN